MGWPPAAWIASTAALFIVGTSAIAYRSISNTVGVMHEPSVNGTAQMFTFTPPVDTYRSRPCSWYCHRLLRGGSQRPAPRVGFVDGFDDVQATDPLRRQHTPLRRILCAPYSA